MGFSWMGKMVAGLSFCFQHDGETHLPNQGVIGFLLSTSHGETYLPKRRMSATIRSGCGFQTSFAKFRVSLAIGSTAKLTWTFHPVR
jgi:hypothetical protein